MTTQQLIAWGFSVGISFYAGTLLGKINTASAFIRRELEQIKKELSEPPKVNVSDIADGWQKGVLKKHVRI